MRHVTSIAGSESKFVAGTEVIFEADPSGNSIDAFRAGRRSTDGWSASGWLSNRRADSHEQQFPFRFRVQVMLVRILQRFDGVDNIFSIPEAFDRIEAGERLPFDAGSGQASAKQPVYGLFRDFCGKIGHCGGYLGRGLHEASLAPRGEPVKRREASPLLRI
jgi:hypothetical protein